MASNSFGNLFRVTTWGESHGPMLGVVIDGCPAGLTIDDNPLQHALSLRSPGRNTFTSPREEADQAQIVSGVFEGKSTGAPISILIPNNDARSSAYEPIKHLIRPGHANATYLDKYGLFDYRGGGRASARETACRVAAASIADALLAQHGIHCSAFLQGVTGYHPELSHLEQTILFDDVSKSPVFAASINDEKEICKAIEQAKQAGNSLGGIVAFQAHHVPPGLGDPVYEKLEACLAKAMLSIPASKGFEIGEGFQAAHMHGLEHNDTVDHNTKKPTSNHAGGTLGGISSGQMIAGRVAFKPASSIQHTQNTLTLDGEKASFTLPEGSRHDPCVAVRAVPVVRAMLSLTLADALLMHRLARTAE